MHRKLYKCIIYLGSLSTSFEVDLEITPIILLSTLLVLLTYLIKKNDGPSKKL